MPNPCFSSLSRPEPLFLRATPLPVFRRSRNYPGREAQQVSFHGWPEKKNGRLPPRI